MMMYEIYIYIDLIILFFKIVIQNLKKKLFALKYTEVLYNSVIIIKILI